MHKSSILIALTAILLFLASCGQHTFFDDVFDDVFEISSSGGVLDLASSSSVVIGPSSSSNENDEYREPDVYNNTNNVKKAVFEGETVTIDFENLTGNDIYLVKVNKSEFKVNASATGGTSGTYPSFSMGNIDNSWQQDMTGLPAIGGSDTINFPEPPIENPPRISAPPAYAIGATKKFWVSDYFSSRNYIQIDAKLEATGTHVNIWVYDRGIDRAQAERLARKFDIIYPSSTNILGYEFGGGPGGDGGLDGDSKIQILVHHIVSAGGLSVAGYFSSVDNYTQTQINGWSSWAGYKSNEAEIFYLNASSIIESPDYMDLSMTHEFQHMINHNVKRVKHKLNPASWYNEMLSLMAEEINAHELGVLPTNSGHSIPSFIPYFLANFRTDNGFTEWNSDYASYAKQYAFGAYLLRNFGGAELLKRIMANDKVNVESVSAALNEMSPGMTFEKALSRFGEAMVFSGARKPEGVLTFDVTYDEHVGNYSYRSDRFDIWNMESRSKNIGPAVSDLVQTNMKGHSVVLQSSSEWKNRSGNVSITLTKPSDSNIELYLMAR